LRIEIDVSAANDPNAHGQLDRLLHKIEDGWHVWDTASEPDIAAIEASSWVCDQGRQGKRVREMLGRSIQREVWSSAPHGRRLRVTRQPNGEDELIPEDAARLAEEPLVILVENRNSDGAFLKRVVTELDKPLHNYCKRAGCPIRLDSVGGKGEMPNEVEHRTQGRQYRPRLVVIIDSDRKNPNDNVSHDAKKLQRTCRMQGVPCWVLAKREAENYLPRGLLAARPNAGADHARRVEVWDKLDDDQKNFIDMKHGLSSNPTSVEEELFESLPPTDKKTLAIGFGEGVHECWKIWKVQTAQELRARGQGDLERGIGLIKGEL